MTTVADFERQYGDRKPHHGLLQTIVMMLLDEAGYKSGSEVKLKISPAFQPVPDVIATSGQVEMPYPTRPVDVMGEILSPEDSKRPGGLGVGERNGLVEESRRDRVEQRPQHCVPANLRRTRSGATVESGR